MANIIRLKRRASGGSAGAPASLAAAEPAFNEADKVLYYGFGDNGSGVATSIIPIGGEGAFVAKTGDQSIDGAKTFTTSPILPTPTTADNSTKAATTAFVKAQNYLTANQSISISGDATGSGTTSISLTLANVVSSGTYTKVTVDTKGRVTTGSNLAASDIPTLTSAKISDFDTQVRSSRLDQMATPTADVSFGGMKITGLADPVSNTDAVTKQYADALKAGQDWKDSVRVATTANITLSGAQTIDGVSVTAGQRVLVKDQSTATQNGIYVVAAGAWSRASDADSSSEITTGLAVFVEEGTANAGKQYILTTSGPITLGSTSLVFSQFGGGQTYSAGAGIGISGSTFFVSAGTGLTQDADGLSISSSYAGQATITTVGTIGTGTWQGTAVGLTYGGTGANLSGAADGSIFKKSGTGLAVATAGTDYLNSSSTVDGGTF